MATTPTNNPVPSESPRDLKFNAGKVDEIVNSGGSTYSDRFGYQRYTWQGIERLARDAIYAFGYVTVDSFEDGASLTASNQVLRYEATGDYYRWDGVMPKTVPAGSTPSSSGGVGTGAWLSIGNASLASPSDGAGDALITVKQPYGSTVPVTQHSVNTRIVHIDDWGGDLALAIDNAPQNSILQLGAGPYRGFITKERSNLTIRGVGRPYVSSDNQNLVGGTIIQGTLLLSGDNLIIENMGFDCGTKVTNLINSGGGADGLILHDMTLSKLRSNNHVRNVSALGRDPSSKFHCVLFEGQQHGSMTNILTKYNIWGIVTKASYCNFDNLIAMANNSGSIVIKADTYAPVTSCNYSNMLAFADGWSTCEIGIFLYAATSQMQKVTLTNMSTDGYGSGIKIVCSTRADYKYPGNDISVSNGEFLRSRNVGIETYGALTNTKISNCSAINTILGVGLQVQADATGVALNNIICSSPAGITPPANAVYLAGRFTADNIVSIAEYNFRSLAGITLVPDSDTSSSRSFHLGRYIGTLNLNSVLGVTPGFSLANGWSQAGGGSTVKVIYRDGMVNLMGWISLPPTPWSGKANIMQINGFLAPKQAKRVNCFAYDTSKGSYAGMLSISSSGLVSFDLLAVTTATPSTTSYISLDGISWPLSEDGY